MAFDEANFRKLAKEANYSDDEIDSYIAKQSTVNTATGQEFGTAGEKDIQQKAQELRDAGSPVPGTEAPKEEQSTLSKVFDWVKTPAGTAIATGAAIGAGELARKGLASRKTAMPDVMPQIEPTFTPPAAPAPEAPKAPTFTSNAQPTAMPAQQPYGATTINAPTGVPGPAVPPAAAAPQPVAPVAPAPVDPIQAARIRKAEAEAAIAEHKLQQLQAGPKTVASGKAATPGYSEAEMKMVQQGGAASASKALEAQKIAGSVAPKLDPIAATATPAEKASAVAVVESKPESVVKKPKAAIPAGMTKEEFGMMNHLLGTYGGKENPMAQQAYAQVKEILGYTPAYPKGQGGSLTSEETGKILGWRKESIPGPKVNLTHEMKGILKKGGPAAIAAMVLTPEFAKASTAEKRQIIGESLLPIGLTPTELAPGTLTEKQLKAFEQSQKLGSPYRSVPPPR